MSSLIEILQGMIDPAQREAMIGTLAQNAPPPQNVAQNGVATPPITPTPVPQQTGAGSAGLPGTQSGVVVPTVPTVTNPEQEKAEKAEQLKSLLSSGILPEAVGPASPPLPPGGSGPSLGSAGAAQPFTTVTPTADNQAMMTLARLLQGGA